MPIDKKMISIYTFNQYVNYEYVKIENEYGIVEEKYIATRVNVTLENNKKDLEIFISQFINPKDENDPLSYKNNTIAIMKAILLIDYDVYLEYIIETFGFSECWRRVPLFKFAKDCRANFCGKKCMKLLEKYKDMLTLNVDNCDLNLSDFNPHDYIWCDYRAENYRFCIRIENDEDGLELLKTCVFDNKTKSISGLNKHLITDYVHVMLYLDFDILLDYFLTTFGAEAITDEDYYMKRWMHIYKEDDYSIQAIGTYAVEYESLKCLKVLHKHNNLKNVDMHHMCADYHNPLRKKHKDILTLVGDKLNQSCFNELTERINHVTRWHTVPQVLMITDHLQKLGYLDKDGGDEVKNAFNKCVTTINDFTMRFENEGGDKVKNALNKCVKQIYDTKVRFENDE